MSRSEPVVLSGEEKLRLLVCGLGERGPGDCCKHEKMKGRGSEKKRVETRRRREGGGGEERWRERWREGEMEGERRKEGGRERGRGMEGENVQINNKKNCKKRRRGRGRETVE